MIDKKTTLRLKKSLNVFALRMAGERWPWRLEPAILKWWRKLDKAKAWPETGTRFLIDHAPDIIWGGVGGDSYTEWIYEQGFFSALIKTAKQGPSLRILDFGCGFGKMAAITPPFTHPDGLYIGIDIRNECIEFCKNHYKKLTRTNFVLSADSNPTYSDPTFARPPYTPAVDSTPADSPGRSTYGHDWPVAAGTIDVVTSISVFTHLQEGDAGGYLDKIHEVLAPGGVAILTFLIIDDRSFPAAGKFNVALPPSNQFFTANQDRPEDSIAVTMQGLNELIAHKFSIISLIRATSFDGAALFPQDIAILRKES